MGNKTIDFKTPFKRISILDSIKEHTGIDVSITNTSRGEVTVSIANTITKELKEGRYVWDLMLIRPNNTKTIAVEGTALVTVGISSF